MKSSNSPTTIIIAFTTNYSYSHTGNTSQEGKADSIVADSSTPETLTVRVDRLTPVN